MSRTTLYRNLNGGPAPQYDFCRQRGPVKWEMSLRDTGGLLRSFIDTLIFENWSFSAIMFFSGR
jgi:hypothetical protein